MLLLCIRLPLCREKESKKVFIRVCVIVREEDRKRENFGVNSRGLKGGFSTFKDGAESQNSSLLNIKHNFFVTHESRSQVPQQAKLGLFHTVNYFQPYLSNFLKSLFVS